MRVTRLSWWKGFAGFPASGSENCETFCTHQAGKTEQFVCVVDAAVERSADHSRRPDPSLLLGNSEGLEEASSLCAGMPSIQFNDIRPFTTFCPALAMPNLGLTQRILQITLQHIAIPRLVVELDKYIVQYAQPIRRRGKKKTIGLQLASACDP